MLNPASSLRPPHPQRNSQHNRYSYGISAGHYHQPSYLSSQPASVEERVRPGLGWGPSGSQMRLGTGPERPAIITNYQLMAGVNSGWDSAKFEGMLDARATTFADGPVVGLNRLSVSGRCGGRQSGSEGSGLQAGISCGTQSSFNVEGGTIVHHSLTSSNPTTYSTLHRPEPCPLGSYSALSPFATPRAQSPAPLPPSQLTPSGPTHFSPNAINYTHIQNNLPAFGHASLGSSPSPPRPRSRFFPARSQSASPEPRSFPRTPIKQPSFPPSSTTRPPPHPVRSPTLSPSPSTSLSSGGPAGRRTTFPPSSLSELQLAWDRGEYYPSAEAVAGMMRRSGLTRVQVRGWFANRRQRASDEERVAVAEEARRMGVAGVPF